jgi:hypothetical protein
MSQPMTARETVLVQIGRGSSKIHLSYPKFGTAFCGSGASRLTWGGRVTRRYDDTDENRQKFAAILCRKCFGGKLA